MSYRVGLSREAEQDLERLEDFLFDRALEYGGDPLELIARALAELRQHLQILEINPFTCRIADADPYERELVIPFGRTGYVALFQIVNQEEVLVLAIRHQREDEYR